MRLKLATTVVVLLAVSAASPALAQSREDAREARRHMEIGQEYYLQERWQEAATEFLAAQEIRPHPVFVHNAAMAYHRLGAATEAITLYRQYLDLSPGASDRADVEERIRLLERAAASGTRIVETRECPEGEECPECPEGEECPGEGEGTEVHVRIERVELDPEAAAAGRTAVLQSVIIVEAEPADAQIVLLDAAGTEIARGQAPLEHTADEGRYTLVLDHPEYRQIRTPVQVRSGRFYVFHIEMSQPPAFLQVVSNVPGATIYMDDRDAGPVGSTPYGDVVRTGTHTIWVERPGYETLERQIEIQLGQEEEESFELVRLPFGMLRVLSNVEGATVEVDGEEIGLAPLEDHQLDPGEHRLRVSHRGMKHYETVFDVERGQTTRVLVRLNPSPSRTSAWITMSFTAAAFAAAGILGWYSTVVYSDLETLAEQGRLSSGDPRINGGLYFAVGADVGFAVGTVMAALTLYYFLRDPLPPSEGRIEDPVDFTENPELPGAPAGAGGGAAPATTPDPAAAAYLRTRSAPRRAAAAAALGPVPRWSLSPFGFQVRF